MEIRMELQGRIPSKKNEMRIGNHGLFRDAKIKKQIDDLTLQAKMIWRGREPLERPEIVAIFLITKKNDDIDNKWTTILDCLVTAGVLVNDNIMRGPRPQKIDWRESDYEGVYLSIFPKKEEKA